MWRRELILCRSRQLFSFPFFYVTLFFTVHNFCQGFVLATLGPQVLLLASQAEHRDALSSAGV